MRRFTEWKDARNEAERLANQCKLDVAIRKVKEFGKVGFNVSFASKNDSDYALAEIVKPQLVQGNNVPWPGQGIESFPEGQEQ